VVLPTDVFYCAPCVVPYVKEDTQKALEDAQDLLDEARDVALAHIAVYQQSLRNYHSRRACGRSFEPGNLVLCLKQTSRRSSNRHGKAHTSSTKSSPAVRIDYAIPGQEQMSRTHGTPRRCVASTRRRIRLLVFSLSLPYKQTPTAVHAPYYAFGIDQ
jgi:hypothetical protein